MKSKTKIYIAKYLLKFTEALFGFTNLNKYNWLVNILSSVKLLSLLNIELKNVIPAHYKLHD